ncbi:GDSL-type esterase/lipase family protein [Mucilaginibacter daejeonensis]|uniref:SGNH/GDSL hydrolase family protein n=1 Tax=Mucilaginibacter daejeonensis TaxID=398049 RepID=UPI001D175A92|nr:SGNH/GDSL hydrolase family protein [Mucilaginibacter daejeonensis]UEG52077.1 GDSL-type esterase/lipase family protein [Mucilaginibacter daejeonensis]
MNRSFYLISGLLTWAATCCAQTIDIKPNDTRLHYNGRVDVKADSTMLSWSGNGFDISFEGSELKAMLKDETGSNTYNVVIDGAISNKLLIGQYKSWYTLAEGLPVGKHTLQLFKLTEWGMGRSWFYGLSTGAQTRVLAAPAPRKHKVEFYGNSITCGYAILDTAGKDRGTAQFEDNWQSYAAITARHFNADYSCIARSGIGVLISWFPLIMPEMYDRLDATDPNSHWDFKKYTPDLVVINLFQNDSWLVKQPENPQFKARFGTQAPTAEKIIEAYEVFVKNIRKQYPKAHIICALGSMDATRPGSVWPGYVEKAVARSKDPNISTLMFPYKNTPGHPSASEQIAMAEQLIAHVAKKMKW